MFNPPRTVPDKDSARHVAALARRTFTPRIAEALGRELEAGAELGWLLGREQFLQLAQEIRDAHAATAERNDR